MANYLSTPINYGNPIDTVNEELINTVLATKQQKFNENSAELDAMISKLSELGNYLESDRDKEYLVDRYRQFTEQAVLTGRGLDISKDENAKFIQKSISSVVDDTVRKGIANATTIKQVNAEIAEIKKKEPKLYGRSNHLAVQREIDAYRNGETDDLSGLSYKPYVDVNKNYIDRLKDYAAVNGKKVTEQVLADGSKIVTEVDGMTQDELKTFVERGLTFEEREQLQLDGQAMFSDGQQALDTYNSQRTNFINAETEYWNNVIKEKKALLDSGQLDANNKAIVEKQIEDYQGAVQSVNNKYAQLDNSVQKGDWKTIAGYISTKQFIENFAYTWADKENVSYDKFLYEDYNKTTTATNTAQQAEYEKQKQGTGADAIQYFGSVSKLNELDKEGSAKLSNLEYYKITISNGEEKVNNIVSTIKSNVGETTFNSAYAEEFENAKARLGAGVNVKDIELEAQKATLIRIGTPEAIEASHALGVEVGKIRQMQERVIKAHEEHEKGIAWDKVGEGLIGRDNVKGVFKTNQGNVKAYSYDEVVKTALNSQLPDGKKLGADYKVTTKDFKEVMSNPKYSGYTKTIRTAIEVNDYLNDMNSILTVEDKEKRVEKFIENYNKFNGTKIKMKDAVTIVNKGSLVETPVGLVKANVPQVSVQYNDKVLSSIIQSAVNEKTYSIGGSNYGYVANNALKNIIDQETIDKSVNIILEGDAKNLRAQNQLNIFYKADDSNTKNVDEARFHKRAIQKLKSADTSANFDEEADVYVDYDPKNKRFTFYQNSSEKVDGKTVPKQITSVISEQEVFNDPDLSVAVKQYQNMDTNAIKITQSITKQVAYNKTNSLYGYNQYYLKKYGYDPEGQYRAEQKVTLLSPKKLSESMDDVKFNNQNEQISGMREQFVDPYTLEKGLKVEKKKEIVNRALQNANSFVVELAPDNGTDQYKKKIYIMKGNERFEIEAYQPPVETDRQGILEDAYNTPEIFLSEMLDAVINASSPETEKILEFLDKTLPAFNSKLKLQ